MTRLVFPILYTLVVLLANVKSIQHTFPGTTPGFYDITLNNFKGATDPPVWTYQFTARTGDYKISMHFFTKLEGNVEIKLYDGPDGNSPKINISSILNNAVFSGNSFIAPHVSATGRQMYIEITPLAATNGFQAIVTDHQNNVADGCSKNGDIVLVSTQDTSKTSYTSNMIGTNCINVLRSVDLTNSPTQTTYIEFENGPAGVKVFKGLDISENSQLLTNVDPFPITDRNIILQRTAPTKINVYWTHLASAVTLKDFSYTQIGSLMTQDYISYTPPSLQTKVLQIYDFNPTFLKNYPTGTPYTIEFSILKKLGSSLFQVATVDSTGTYVSTTNVTDSADGSLPVKFNVTGARMVMTYTNDKVPYTNGLYATYQLKEILGTRVTQPPVTKVPPGTKASSSLTPISVLVLLLVKLFA